jgi:RNA polymerase sigma-B factor
VLRELADRYRDGTEPRNELVHLAMVGLLNAIDRFDPELGVPFSSVAMPSIMTELKRHDHRHRWGGAELDSRPASARHR